MTEKRDVYSIVTDQVIEALEGGRVPWHKPWTAENGLPTSLSSGKEYRGINPFLLACSAAAQGFESPYWLTYKQCGDRGGQVRKGSKSSLVVFWKRLDGLKRVPDPDNPGEKLTTLGASMVLRYYNVFNVEQCDDLTYPKPDQVHHEWDAIERCEMVSQGYVGFQNVALGRQCGPNLVNGGGRACYSPSADVVRMPERTAFALAEEYYSTLFHELTHSTGHASRLARKELLEMHSFGDPSYSREELVAEMGAAMLCGVTGIDQVTIANSAAYLANWLGVLRGDKKMIVTAAAQAQKAADLIRGISFAERQETMAA